jgi:hypothetical protein
MQYGRTDHPIDSVRRDFNEVVKRLLGEGVAYDAILVGSYAHRYRRPGIGRT